MTQTTKIEEKFKKRILEEHLKTSLDLIRQATLKIWASDAPRIIKDYTDHGIEHSKRIISYVEKLLFANSGRTLTSVEVYLLLASIYLHDIGMQCDVVKYPEIKKKALEIGANFNIRY